jgi:predicted component of type VI protein secretion system
MKVQLKVLSGAHTGKLVRLGAERFVIGRGEDCNLRSSSDAVSRRHCEIMMKDAEVTVRDLGSRNGTSVNGQPIKADQILRSGDRLEIGPLRFEVLISEVPSAPASQPPPVQRLDAGSGGKWNDDTVGQWLDEADAAEKAQRLTEPDTRIFRFDETIAVEGSSKESKGKKPAPPKKPPAKLPPKKDNSKDSQEAAAQMLRRLFNRG